MLSTTTSASGPQPRADRLERGARTLESHVELLGLAARAHEVDVETHEHDVGVPHDVAIGGRSQPARVAHRAGERRVDGAVLRRERRAPRVQRRGLLAAGGRVLLDADHEEPARSGVLRQGRGQRRADESEAHDDRDVPAGGACPVAQRVDLDRVHALTHPSLRPRPSLTLHHATRTPSIGRAPGTAKGMVIGTSTIRSFLCSARSMISLSTS